MLARRDGTPHCSSSATACVAALPTPATCEPRLHELERERHFRAHEHERPQPPVRAHLLGEEDHRRNADAAAEREQPRPRRIDGEAVADRREHAQDLARLTEPKHLEPVALRLVQELEPAFGGRGAHDRQRPAHRHRRVAGDMRERAGLRLARRARRLDAQHELLSRPSALREDARVLEEHAAAIPFVAHCFVSLLAHPLLRDQARRHAVDATLADAAAKIPGSALLRELGLRGGRGQRLVDGRDGQPVALGQVPRRTRARAARSAAAPSPSGTPTTSCAGRQSSMMRSSSRQGGSRSTRSVVSGDAVRVSRFAVAMPIRRSPKSNATRMWRSRSRSLDAPRAPSAGVQA